MKTPVDVVDLATNKKILNELLNWLKEKNMPEHLMLGRGSLGKSSAPLDNKIMNLIA